MKKNYIVLCLVWVIALFSYGYASCILGADKMSREKEYTVTINGIEMYKDAATVLLRQIIKEEKDSVSVVDEKTKTKLEISTEILKPKMDILIENSKNIATMLELFEILKEHAVKFPNEVTHSVKDRNIISTKYGDRFGISDEFNKTFLYINSKIQIIKMYILKNELPGDIEKAIPMHE